ncbi:hypothetical protein [Brevundimonas sp. NPDC058933]|uniref:hypothetical protein n=1 Tax=Brevundimonas sp. NPDC058933 TaxID=3346673 RepID=UPI003BEED101
MPSGIQTFDTSGNVLLDTSTLTSRIIGTRTATAGHFEAITVPLASGKSLWWHFHVSGSLAAYCYRQIFVDGSQNQGANQFTIQVDGPSWGAPQNGTAYIWYGEHGGSASNGGSTQPDRIPNAITLSNITFNTNDNTASANRTWQVSGINQTVGIKVIRHTNAQGGNMSVNRTYVRTASSQNGPWTTHGTMITNGEVEILVTDGMWIQIAVEMTTSSGRATASYGLTLTNNWDASTYAGCSVSATLDADNNYGVTDATLDPLNWANISASDSRQDYSTQNAYLTLSGINTTVNLRAALSNVTGTFSAGTRLEMWVGGAMRYHSTNVANGSWAGGNFSNGEQVCFVARCVATGTIERNVSYTVTVTNQTTGATIDTFTVNQTGNVADETPDTINFPTFNVSSNDPDVSWSSTSYGTHTVTGINRPITVRFERYDFTGNAVLHIDCFIWPPGASDWQHVGYFTASNGGYQSLDVPNIVNGTRIAMNPHAISTGGRRTASCRLVLWSMTGTGGQFMTTGTCQFVVDNDNNYTTPDTTPDPVGALNAIAPSTTAEVAWGAPRNFQITGINQPITLRVTKSHVAQSGNLARKWLYVRTGTDGTNFNEIAILQSDNQTFDFTVSNGTWVQFGIQVLTSSGYANAQWNVTVSNLTAGGTITSMGVNATVDSDNNFNMPVGPTGSLTPSFISGYNSAWDTFRPVTASASASLSISGGSGPYSVVAELQNVNGTQPLTSTATNSVTVRVSSANYVYATGQVRARITDANNQVGYSNWINYELQIDSGTIGPDV